MTLEFVLLILVFVYFVMGSMMSTPMKTYADYGPRLGARVEKQLLTGDGFRTNGRGQEWSK